MKSKKSQMEIMGLAIVVVLLIMGMLFAVKFILFKPQESYREDYTTTQLSANLINTILNTDTNCKGISVTKLLQDASKDNPSIDCYGYESGYYVNQTIGYLLWNVTDTLKRDFHFKASVPGKVVSEAGIDYTSRERERKQHFLQTDVGVMTVELDIYGQ